MGENASAIILRKLPKKCRDPDMISIPCVIGNKKIDRAMLDLRAFINVMLYSVYCELNLGQIKEIRVIIKLVDRSKTHLEGVNQLMGLHLEKYPLTSRVNSSVTTSLCAVHEPFGAYILL